MENNIFSNKEYVYEVYKKQSFSKAAQSLYITQPCLSAMVKKIEKKIGMELFDRHKNPIRPTACGREYIRCVETIQHLEADFIDYVNDMNELRIGQLSVGANNVFASFVLPSIIHRFSAQYPKIKVSLIESNTAALEEKLFSGDLDLVLDNYPLDDSIYDKQFLGEEHLVLAVPAGFPVNREIRPYCLTLGDILSGRHLRQEVKALPMRHMAGVPFIFLRPGNDTRLRADRIFAQAQIEPHVILELDQLATAYNVTCSGIGAAFISDTLAIKMQTAASVSFYKIEPQQSTRTVYFYLKKNKYRTKAMREFLRIASEIVAEILHPIQPPGGSINDNL